MKKLLLGLVALMTLSLGACKANSQVSAGRGIADTYVNADGYLVIVYTDGTEDIAGYVKGEQGPQGEPGADGQDGKDGTDGKDGVDGKDGKNGIDGQDGKDGADGKSFVWAQVNKTLEFDFNYIYTGDGNPRTFGLSIDTIVKYAGYLDYSSLTLDNNVFSGTIKTKENIVSNITSLKVLDTNNAVYIDETYIEPKSSIGFNIQRKSYSVYSTDKYFEYSHIELTCGVWEYTLEQ